MPRRIWYGLAYACFGVAISFLPGAFLATLVELVCRELIRVFSNELAALQSARRVAIGSWGLLMLFAAFMAARHGRREADAQAGPQGPVFALVIAIVILGFTGSYYMVRAKRGQPKSKVSWINSFPAPNRARL